MIRKENGNTGLSVVSIGTAGEKLSHIAAVINDGGRAATRSGLGAVMGSKNMKAVACIGSKTPELFDKSKVQSLVKEMLKKTKENPSSMHFVVSNFGTPGAMVHHLEDHDVPIRNWGGNNIKDFPREKWAGVGWDGMAKYVTKKYACTGCPFACRSLLNVKDGKYPVIKGQKPDYETLAAFGPMCLNDNMESLIYANELCNLQGLDTISAGSTVAFAIVCFENGILTNKDTDDLELTWGNPNAVIEVLRKMCIREGIGDILADGAKAAAQKIGHGAENFAMHVGGKMLAFRYVMVKKYWLIRLYHNQRNNTLGKLS
jgi:aldehyde:ferredoxin oxidoreductase